MSGTIGELFTLGKAAIVRASSAVTDLVSPAARLSTTNQAVSVAVRGTPAATAATPKPDDKPPTPEVAKPVTTEAPKPLPPTDKLSDTETAAMIKKILSGPVLENPLNNLYQSSYHFRLFMTQDVDPYAHGTTTGAKLTNTADLYSVIDGLPQVTLAETGVTTYNIKSVEMDTTVGPNPLTRSMNAGLMTIIITEPMGLGFQESIIAASKKLKVYNYNKHFFYLELRFHGYDEAGNYNGNPVSPLKLPNGSRWIMMISINQIDVHFDAGGGTYTIACSPTNEVNAYASEIIAVPSTLKITGGTLGAYTDDLAAQMSRDWISRYQNSVVIYKIVWHPFSDVTTHALPGLPTNAKEFAVTNAQPALSSTRQAPMSGNGQTATQHPGVTIDKMIEAVIENCEQAQKLAKGTSITGSTDNPDPKQPRQSIVFRIEPDVEFTGKFEIYSQQYYRIITYHVRPFITQMPFIDKKQPVEALEPVVSWNAMREMIEKGLVKKHYDYIYTGLNTEILDLDIKFSYTYNAEITRGEGEQSDAEAVAYNARILSGAAGTDGQRQALVLNQEIKVASDQLVSIDVQTTRARAILEKLAATPPPVNADDLRRQLKLLLGDESNDLTTLLTQHNKFSSLISAKVDQVSALDLANRGQVQPTPTRVFSESLLDDPTPTPPDDMKSPRILPVSFSQNYKNSSDNVQTGSTGQYHRDKSVFAQVLGQLYGPIGLIDIQLTVRGDPFWLGEQNVSRMVRMRNITDLGLIAPTDNIPETSRGDNCFVLKFRAPRRIGDDFVPVFDDSMVFNGVYMVNSIRHVFADGGFKQILSGHRLALIDILKAANYDPSSNDLPKTGEAIASSAPIGSGGTVATTQFRGSQSDFLTQMTPYALRASAATGISPEIILAQSALESSYGRSAPGNSYLGIKAAPGQAGTTTGTHEVINGQTVSAQATFASYENAQASFDGYAVFINKYQRYGALKAAGASGDLEAQTAALQASHYATDPNYGAKVLSIAKGIRATGLKQ